MTFFKKSREANMDLLRIISMLIIIFLHSIDHSGVLENADNSNAGIYFYVRFTYAMCMVCVNIYVMLSGYFLVKSKFRLHKLVSLWIEAAFYSFILKMVFMLFGNEPFSIVSLISCILQYWREDIGSWQSMWGCIWFFHSWIYWSMQWTNGNMEY